MQQPVTSHIDHQAITTSHDFSQIGVPFFHQQVSSAQGNPNNNAAANTVLVSAYSMSPMMSAPGAPRMSFAGNMISPNTSAAAAAAGMRLPVMSPVGLHGIPPGPRTPDGQPLLSPMGPFPGYPYASILPPLESPTSLLQTRLQHPQGFPFSQHAAIHPQQVFFSGAYEDQGAGLRAPHVEKMSWLDATEIILEEAGQPLHLKDIKQRIVEQGLVGPNARSSLETLMYRDAQKGSKRFVKLEEQLGVFRLMTPEERKAARKSNKKTPKQTAAKAAATTPTTLATSEAASTTPAAVATIIATSPTAAAQAQRNAKFKRKSQNLRRLIKAMVFENAALCDEVSRAEAKLPRARAERRFLLLRLLHYQALTGQSIQESDQQTAKKEAAQKEKEVAKVARKEKAEKMTKKEKEKEKEKKKDKSRHKHKKNKKSSKAEAEKKAEPNPVKKKKPSSSLKRHILPIPMTDEGHPVFPIVLGSLTVFSLGEALPDKPSFHSDRFIYPAGFHSNRVYGSMDDPNRRCVYTCRIINSDGEAKFEITNDSQPAVTLTATSATKCHKKLLQAINKAFGEDIVNESRDRAQEFFGFSHPTIQNLIQGLEGANQCAAYRWLRFEECKAEEREKIAHWYESDPTVCYQALVNAYKKNMDERQNVHVVSSSTTMSAAPMLSSPSTASLSTTHSTSSSESHNLRSLLTSAPIVTPQQSVLGRKDGLGGGSS